MGVFLLDSISGTVATEEHRQLALEIYHRYPNLRFAQVPHSNRGENETHPFAIRDSDTGEIVKTLTPAQANRQYVMRWLWENDSQRVDTWDKFQKEMKAAREAQMKLTEEKDEEHLDLVTHILKSPKHTYRHNGKVYGDGYRSNH